MRRRAPLPSVCVPGPSPWARRPTPRPVPRPQTPIWQAAAHARPTRRTKNPLHGPHASFCAPTRPAPGLSKSLPPIFCRPACAPCPVCPPPVHLAPSLSRPLPRASPPEQFLSVPLPLPAPYPATNSSPARALRALSRTAARAHAVQRRHRARAPAPAAECPRGTVNRRLTSTAGRVRGAPCSSGPLGGGGGEAGGGTPTWHRAAALGVGAPSCGERPKAPAPPRSPQTPLKRVFIGSRRLERAKPAPRRARALFERAAERVPISRRALHGLCGRPRGAKSIKMATGHIRARRGAAAVALLLLAGAAVARAAPPKVRTPGRAAAVPQRPPHARQACGGCLHARCLPRPGQLGRPVPRAAPRAPHARRVTVLLQDGRPTRERARPCGGGLEGARPPGPGPSIAPARPRTPARALTAPTLRNPCLPCHPST
jgi:hypothetical protein